MEGPAGALDPFHPLPAPSALLKELPSVAMAGPVVAQVVEAPPATLMWSSSDPQQPPALMAGTPTASSLVEVGVVRMEPSLVQLLPMATGV
jgi:hypothetical protein